MEMPVEVESIIIDTQEVRCRVVKQVGDGNCLFRSIAYHVYNTPNSHPRVRQEIVDYVYAHFSQYQNYTVTDSTTDRAFENAEKYKEEMSRLEVWGSYAEILAASALYKYRIIVFRFGKLMAQAGNAFPNCILLKYNGVHYDVYQPISNNECKTATFFSEHAAKEIEKSFSSPLLPDFPLSLNSC